MPNTMCVLTDRLICKRGSSLESVERQRSRRPSSGSALAWRGKLTEKLCAAATEHTNARDRSTVRTMDFLQEFMNELYSANGPNSRPTYSPEVSRPCAYSSRNAVIAGPSPDHEQ